MAVTLYTDKYEPDGGAGYDNKSVNAQGITDINANNELKLALLHEDDFKGDSAALWTNETTGGFFNQDGGNVYFGETAGTSFDPKLVVTYTDGSTETHYADSSGNFDDAWMRVGPEGSEANLLSARNGEDADYITDSITNIILGHYQSIGSGYMSRAIFRFATNASKTASSAVLYFYIGADITSGFLRREWHDKGFYVCKMSSDVSTTFGTEDWSHLDGWASSGSYEATEEEAVVYNATFFGANF